MATSSKAIQQIQEKSCQAGESKSYHQSIPSRIPRALNLVRQGNITRKQSPIRQLISRYQPAPLTFVGPCNQKLENSNALGQTTNNPTNQTIPRKEDERSAVGNLRMLKPVTKLSGSSIRKHRIVAVSSRSAHNKKSRIPVRCHADLEQRIKMLRSEELKLIKSLLEVRQILDELEEKKLRQQFINRPREVPQELTEHQQHSLSASHSPSAEYVRPLKKRIVLEELAQ